MTGFVVVGTDTDAGKTTFSTLFLAAFANHFAYWKPVETGESDTERVRTGVPGVQVYEPLARFAEAVAPPLAARREARSMPGLDAVLAACPASPKPLLIETFGGPFSPFSDAVLQIELIRRFGLPVVLVGSTALGAIGRTLGTIAAIKAHHVEPVAVVLMGPRDDYAQEEIARHLHGVLVVGLTPPEVPWNPTTFQAAANAQRAALDSLKARLDLAPVSHTRAEAASALAARDGAVIWHPYTALQNADPPLAVVAAKDEFLQLADGRTLIDGISSWWTILHGHCHPAIMQAIREATRTLDHAIFAGFTHTHAIELAEFLLAAMPWAAGGRVFYSDNGSTAVEVALKMAYQYWCHRGEAGRRLFVGFENAYHGDTFGAMAVGRDPLFFGRFEPLLFQTLTIPLSPAALDEALQQHRGQVAAVILEPLIQGAGGMRMHPPDDLLAMAEVARNHGVLFIADEVMTGFGRTGSFFAFEQAGIVPDLVCLAKGITGGVLPLSATLAAPHVVSVFDSPDREKTFFHGHSFTANPLACAAAVASAKLLRAGGWKRDVDRIHQTLKTRLESLIGLPGVKDVRCRGLIAAVEMEATGGYLAEIAAVMRRTCLARDVLLRPLGNVLYTMPPLCTSAESLGRIADAMTAAVQACRPPNGT